MTRQQLAERASNLLINDVPTMYWFVHNPFLIIEPNCMTPAFNTGKIGGLVSQTISFARLKLDDDEAFVVTADSFSAPFRGIALQDFWLRSLDPGNHTSSMNNSQGLANEDGTTTYVISRTDVGVHNWIDTTGLESRLSFTAGKEWRDPRAALRRPESAEG